MTYTLEYWQEGEWYGGQLKEKPNVLSQGRTMEELEANIREVYALITEVEAERPPQPVLHAKTIELTA